MLSLWEGELASSFRDVFFRIAGFAPMVARGLSGDSGVRVGPPLVALSRMEQDGTLQSYY
jgi:hypothetical protein